MFENPAALFSALGLGYLAIAAWPLAKIDIRERRLPNRIVLPAIPITLLGQIAGTLLGASIWNLIWAIATAVITFLAALLLNRFELLGMGDVKLMTAMALALGWYSPIFALVALALSFLAAGLVATTLFAIRKIALGSSLPLGPYLLVGFLGAVTLAVWS